MKFWMWSLCPIPGKAPDSNHPMDASASACPTQGNNSSIPYSSTHATSSKEDMHHTDRVIGNASQHVASTTANASQSDDQDDSLLHHLKPSVAKRMKTRKGRFVAKMMSAKTAKKTAGVGPSKSWSKIDVKNRKVREVSESDEDVEEDVPDISLVKRTTVKKSPVKVVTCYEGLVKEFIVNIPEDIVDKNNKEFCKVFVRGKCITFSPTVINKFLGRGIEGACQLEATDNKVCREITTRQVKEWPSKKHLPAGKLTVKYAILHKIGSANWVPTNHISTI
ncbi:uncharacterized protein LOC127104678 [Lathyrus oleraceus]|uniref:uncharacterized protein LOC127104678 n=1 Tax=Pisum sativum TaxID=3888 RepID=UPI0021D3E6EE|nr:uncharacterized protein LOC127104678 [Pisum sativum]